VRGYADDDCPHAAVRAINVQGACFEGMAAGEKSCPTCKTEMTANH
jgi:hypothetical protein